MNWHIFCGSEKQLQTPEPWVLTAGSQPTFGIQSLIRDPEILRQKYGFGSVQTAVCSIVPYMDQITDEEARPIADKILNGSKDTKVNTDWFIQRCQVLSGSKENDGCLPVQRIFYSLS